MSFQSNILLDNIPQNFESGIVWLSGSTQQAREIHRENLSIDFTLTSISFQCLSVVGLDGSNPGIIRVYQEGQEASAALLEISGTGSLHQEINLDILGSLGTNRTVILDGFDPSTDQPNNSCSFTGSVSVTGKPKLSTAGATSNNEGG